MAASCNRAVVADAVASSVAAAAKAAQDPRHAYIVPESMYLRESTKEANFEKFPLFPLNIDIKEKIISESEPIASGEVIKNHTGELGSICLVVRRPGWPFCREEGLTLSELAANENKPLEGFGVFGVVKETGVDDKGLADFTGFFPFPLYRDQHLDFYTALGNRNITIPLNPIKLVSGAVALVGMQKRLNEKKIEGNFKGEGIKQGGLIIFDKEGNPKYAIYEKTGKELSVEDILAAVHAIRKEAEA